MATVAMGVMALGLCVAGSAYAACVDCHNSTAPNQANYRMNPAAHSVNADPWIFAWDAPDGQCVVCHEIQPSVLPIWNSAPYGPYSLYAGDGSGGQHEGDIQWAYCMDCHSNSPWYSHAITFPMPATINLAPGPSRPIDCAGCHTSGMSQNEISPLYIDDDAVTFIGTSEQAHVESFHTGVSEAGCDSCHPNALADRHAACTTCHPNASSGWSGYQNVPGKTCSSSGCHDNLGPNHGDPAAAHAGAVTPECVECHGSALEVVHSGCDSCHPPYSGPGVSGETCASCHPSYNDGGSHGLLFFSGPFNPGYRPFDNSPTEDGFVGYLRWRTNSPGGQAWSGDNSTSPHGNYATTTNKCAVCHSVHMADRGGAVLTAWPGIDTATASGGEASSASCIFCHGESATFTPVRINTQTTSIDPHGGCYRCHTVSPHGAGASVYPVLQQKLLLPIGDVAIEADIADATTGVTADMFDLSDPAKIDAGASLGTGYLCASSGTGCHHRSAFAVASAGHTPYGSFLDGDFAADNPQFTGHRVLATATDTWDAETYGAAASNVTRVAWAPADSCRACHDAQTWWGQNAFPHNYVDEFGASVAKSADSSYVWLTTGAYAGGTREILKGTRASADTTHNAEPLTRDGLCLKCHVKDAGKTAGVGITY